MIPTAPRPFTSRRQESLLIDLRRHPAVRRTRALVLLNNLIDRLPR
ncbi:hypothetical protein [Nonomuraea deserti]|nr:hypothetical protein [Nonomuraea deserti]